MTTKPRGGSSRSSASTADERAPDAPAIASGDLAKARAAVLEELAALANKRRENRVEHKKNTKRLGPAVRKAAEYGWPYGDIAAHFKINSRMLYRHGGTPEAGSKTPRAGQLDKIKEEVELIFIERRDLDLEYEADGKKAAELVRVAHIDLDIDLVQLQKTSGVARSTFYSWLGLAHSSPKLTKDGTRSKKVDANTVPTGGKRVLWKNHRDSPNS